MVRLSIPAWRFPCRVKGNLRIKGIRTTSPVAVGDIVTVAGLPPMTPTSSWPSSRAATYIIRRASNLSKESHILASNLDCAALVISLRDPATPTTFIDRFLATAEGLRHSGRNHNKQGRHIRCRRHGACRAMKYLYESIGYGVTVVRLGAYRRGYRPSPRLSPATRPLSLPETTAEPESHRL